MACNIFRIIFSINQFISKKSPDARPLAEQELDAILPWL